VLAIEIGAGEADATIASFERAGFTDVRAHKDIARIDRVVSGIAARE
jgi:methylase of polypeptide subunit release factors